MLKSNVNSLASRGLDNFNLNKKAYNEIKKIKETDKINIQVQNILLPQKKAGVGLARKIGLESLLTLGKSVTRTNDRQKDKILGNAMEALIGALFLAVSYTHLTLPTKRIV